MHWLQRIDDDIRRQRSLRDDDDEHEPSATDRGRDTGEKDNVNPVITANDVELEFDDDNRTARDETRVRSVRSRVRTRKRNHRWSLRSRALFAALVASLMLTVFISLVLSLRMLSLSEENDELRHQNELRDAELTQVRPELERLRADVTELIAKRLPGLRQLVLDQVVPIDDYYLRNVMFTLVKRGKRAGYEYHLTLSNDTLQMVLPRVNIYLFDRHGVHIGSARIGGTGEHVEEVPDLGPGETVTKVGLVTIGEGEEEPVFFRVRVAEPYTAEERESPNPQR